MVPSTGGDECADVLTVTQQRTGMMFFCFVLHTWAHPIYVDPQLGFPEHYSQSLSMLMYIPSFTEPEMHPHFRVVKMWGHTQLTLTVCGFCICKFASWLKCIYKPTDNTHSAFTVLRGHAQSQGTSETPGALAASWGWSRHCLALSSCSQTINKCPFQGLLSAMAWASVCSLLVSCCGRWPQA